METRCGGERRTSKHKKFKRIANHLAVVALVCLFVFFSLYFNENAYAMQEVGSIALNSGESRANSMVTDGTYAYVGTNTSPAMVVKVRLSDLSRVGAVALNSGENSAISMVTDGTYAYVGTSTCPAKIVKVRLSDLSRVGAITLNSGENFANSMVTDGTYAYVGTNTSPAMVVKVRLSDLSRVGSVTLNPGQNSAIAMVTDGTYAYVGTNTSPAMVAKVRLSDLSKVGSVALNSGENYAYSMVTDGTYAYMGTYTSPAMVVKVRLSDLSRVGAVTLNSGENYAYSMVTDGTYAYVGTYTSPAMVVKVRLSDLSREGAVALNSGENQANSMVTDGTYAYVGTNTSPAMVVKVLLGDQAPAPAIPTGLTATSVFQNLINLQWQPNTEQDLAGYRIYRNDILLATVDKKTTTYSDTTVVPGTNYTYQISAYNTSNLESYKSSLITVTTLPVTPTNVTGQGTGKQVNINWQGSGYQQYIVQRSTDGVNFTQVAQVTQTSYTEMAPLWGTTYYYRVAQKGQDGAVSAFSDPVRVMTDPVPVPTDLTAVLDGKNVNLSWQSADGITSYVVERSTDNATWSSLANVSNATSYTDEATDPNTTYYYRVRSDGGNGQISETSNTVAITTPPAAPTGLTATAAGRNISLTWSGSAGAASYVLQRSSGGTNFSQIAEVTATSYLDSVTNWNTVYYYRVLAKSESGLLSVPSSTAQVKTAPAPPANLRASVSHNNVTLNWDSSEGADSYVVQRSIDGDNSWLDIGSTSQNSYTDSGLGWNLTFDYRVLGKNADGLVSEPSSPVSATTENVPAPTGLTVSLSGDDVILNWQAVPYVTMYIIERSTDGLTWEFLVEVGNTTTYTDMNPNLNSSYYYRVRSDGGNQVSEASNIVMVSTPPAAPTGLAASVDGKTVTLTWSGPDNVSFLVERSTDGLTWGQVAEVSQKIFKDTVPLWDTTYYYRVLAKNSDGMVSEPSDTAQAVIPPVPAPTGLTADVSGNSVTLTWNGVKGISTYRIERSQNGIIWSNLMEVSATSYKDTDLAWQAKYYYRVRAVDSDQVSQPSETASVETPVPPTPESPKITYSVDNTNVKLSWNYQSNSSGYNVYINGNLAAELSSDETTYSFTGERGKSYTVVIEAYNANGSASSAATVNISEMPTPSAGTMAGDIIKYGGAVVVSTGGLIALGLALKGSGWLVAVIKMFLWR